MTKTIAILLLSLTVTLATAQSSRFAPQKFISKKGDTLLYRQLSDYNNLQKYPLVIFLHGSGERGSDNEAQLKWGVGNFATDEWMKLHPAIVIAPQCPENMQWANISIDANRNPILLPTPSKPMSALIELIEQFKTNKMVDTNRIYITGLSMGGYGTYDAIERYPNLFAAAVPVCGAGDTSRAASIKHIPIWIFHGADDAAVNPDYSFKMLDALKKAGARPGFTQYPNVGHFSWIGAYSDAMMVDWLFRQTKQNR
ncbi:MAG: prolyl oligopeptidase family serine peptidase [Chitinophagaceae bacterium]|nr:prolyl oligopeptidase family serine peptidase [Chitinophagaceae bacterium]